MPGTSNFIQVNPTQANQETDSAYAADSLTTGGIHVDAILPSPWLNKFYYQASTFIAAFCQMMANKGYTLSDASITTLEAVLAHVLTDADTKTPLVNVTFASNIVFDASAANGFFVSLTGNVTSSSIINMAIGQIVTIMLKQDGAGGRTFSPPPQVYTNHWWPIQTASNSYTVQQFQKNTNGDIVRVDTADIDLFSAIAVINSTLTTINGQITALNSSVGTLNSQVSTLFGDIGTINGQISTINGQISSLNSTVSGLASQVSVLNSYVPTFGSNVNGFWRIDNATGVIEQWGTISSNVPSGATLTFPIPFTDASTVAITPTEYNPLGGTTRTPAVSSWNTTQWVIGWSGAGSSPLIWYAIGK